MKCGKAARTQTHNDDEDSREFVIEFFSINAKFVEAVYLWWYWRKENCRKKQFQG